MAAAVVSYMETRVCVCPCVRVGLHEAGHCTSVTDSGLGRSGPYVTREFERESCWKYFL